jgi:hypothetical protein
MRTFLERMTSKWTIGVLICCFIVVLLLLGRDGLLPFTLCLLNVLFLAYG